MCLEVPRGGDVVHGDDYRAAPSVVLCRAEEALGDGHLVDYLPGGAGRLARRVAWVVVAIAPAASMRSVACESTFADVFNGDGPGGLGWLLYLGRV